MKNESIIMEVEPNGTIPPARARPFPIHCDNERDLPGLRCGHTLTAITPEKNPSSAKLVMFGESPSCSISRLTRRSSCAPLLPGASHNKAALEGHTQVHDSPSSFKKACIRVLSDSRYNSVLAITLIKAGGTNNGRNSQRRLAS